MFEKFFSNKEIQENSNEHQEINQENQIQKEKEYMQKQSSYESLDAKLDAKRDRLALEVERNTPLSKEQEKKIFQKSIEHMTGLSEKTAESLSKYTYPLLAPIYKVYDKIREFFGLKDTEKVQKKIKEMKNTISSNTDVYINKIDDFVDEKFAYFIAFLSGKRALRQKKAHTFNKKILSHIEEGDKEYFQTLFEKQFQDHTDIEDSGHWKSFFENLKSKGYLIEYNDDNTITLEKNGVQHKLHTIKKGEKFSFILIEALKSKKDAEKIIGKVDKEERAQGLNLFQVGVKGMAITNRFASLNNSYINVVAQKLDNMSLAEQTSTQKELEKIPLQQRDKELTNEIKKLKKMKGNEYIEQERKINKMKNELTALNMLKDKNNGQKIFAEKNPEAFVSSIKGKMDTIDDNIYRIEKRKQSYLENAQKNKTNPKVVNIHMKAFMKKSQEYALEKNAIHMEISNMGPAFKNNPKLISELNKIENLKITKVAGGKFKLFTIIPMIASLGIEASLDKESFKDDVVQAGRAFVPGLGTWDSIKASVTGKDYSGRDIGVKERIFEAGFGTLSAIADVALLSSVVTGAIGAGVSVGIRSGLSLLKGGTKVAIKKSLKKQAEKTSKRAGLQTGAVGMKNKFMQSFTNMKSLKNYIQKQQVLNRKSKFPKLQKWSPTFSKVSKYMTYTYFALIPAEMVYNVVSTKGETMEMIESNYSKGKSHLANIMQKYNTL
jgi:hypothetical protein